MTKKELLARAAELDIEGRHGMNKDDLAAAIKKAERPKINKSPISENYVPTTPYRRRSYVINEKITEFYEKLPAQAKAIFDFMETHNTVGLNGKQIAEAAKEAGMLKTKQDGAILFAYYARRLEQAGVILAGHEADEEEEA